MAYVLGFVVADGCVIKRKNRKHSYFLNITNKEKKHLENIGMTLGWQGGLGAKHGGYTSKKNYYYIQSCSREICEDLIALGVKPHKTHSLEPIKVPRNYFSDFVRGFFDGDDSVYIYIVNGTPRIKASFYNPKFSFSTDLNQRICQYLGIFPKTIHQQMKKGANIPLYYINFYIDDCEKFHDFMYSHNPSLYLPRKRKIFEKWKLMINDIALINL